MKRGIRLSGRLCAEECPARVQVRRSSLISVRWVGCLVVLDYVDKSASRG